MAETADHPAASTGLTAIVNAVARNLGWLLASRGVLAVLSFFYLGFAAHTLGLKGFGRFALITGAAQAMATFVGFQTWQIIVQYGVEPMQHGDTPKLARLLRACGILDLSSALIGCVLSVLVVSFGAELLNIRPDMIAVTLVFAIVQLITIRSTPLGILRLRDQFSLSALADSVTPLTRFLGAAAAMFLDPTARGFLIAWSIAELLTAATYWILVLRAGDGRLLRTGKFTWRQLFAENKGIARFALSTNANSTLMLSGKQIPLLMVGAAVGPSAAGAFRLAAQFAQALSKLSQLVSRAAFPEFVRAARVLSPAALRRATLRSFLGGSLAAVVILTVVLLVGRFGLRVVGGPAFVSAYPALVWLAAAGCLDLATVGAESVLTALHRALSIFLMRATGVIVLFVAAFLLVPHFGSTAVAMGVFGASVVTAILLVTAAFRIK